MISVRPAPEMGGGDDRQAAESQRLSVCSETEHAGRRTGTDRGALHGDPREQEAGWVCCVGVYLPSRRPALSAWLTPPSQRTLFEELVERDGGGIGGAAAAARPAEATADMAETLRSGGQAAAGGGSGGSGGGGRGAWSVGLRRQYRMPAALMAFPAAGEAY